MDLKRVGLYRYSRDPMTGVWCAAYKIDNEPVQLWKEGDPCPDVIRRAVREGIRAG